ncbi:MAG: hypothetical protein ACKERF_01550 [Candidatus Hodgkinia cicadicola]
MIINTFSRMFEHWYNANDDEVLTETSSAFVSNKTSGDVLSFKLK